MALLNFVYRTKHFLSSIILVLPDHLPQEDVLVLQTRIDNIYHTHSMIYNNNIKFFKSKLQKDEILQAYHIIIDLTETTKLEGAT